MQKFIKAASIAFVALWFMSGCEKNTHQDNTSSKGYETKIFLSDPSEIFLSETPLDALPTWRLYKNLKPTLLLFSDRPAFAAVPQELITRAQKLVESASPQQLLDSTPFANFDPIFLPDMAIRSAILSEYFSQIVWIAPLPDGPPTELSLALMRNHMEEQGLLNQKEIADLKQTQFGFKGRIGDLPLSIMFTPTLSIDETCRYVIHFDMSFFVANYKNEVKTPIYNSIHDFFIQLRSLNISNYATTLSRSNLGNGIPLRFRGIGADIARMIKEPLILDSEIPRSWKIKSQIFYLENFFQPEEIYQLATELTRIDPKDPSSHYELYRAKRLNKLPYNGALESAIENDSIYATEFLILAENAKDPEQTVNFLLNASKHLPSDPVIQLRLAHALIDANDHEKAKKLINSLKRMKWSHIYFPEVISSLEKLQVL